MAARDDLLYDFAEILEAEHHRYHGRSLPCGKLEAYRVYVAAPVGYCIYAKPESDNLAPREVSAYLTLYTLSRATQ